MKIQISIVFMFLSVSIFAQIGSKKSEIIKDHKDYKMEVANNGRDYISYTNTFENYDQIVACYLSKKEENKEQFCYRVLMIEPSSETNNWIKFFNDKNFVKLEGMIWKDYENSIVYKVSVEKGNCLVVKYFDTKL